MIKYLSILPLLLLVGCAKEPEDTSSMTGTDQGYVESIHGSSSCEGLYDRVHFAGTDGADAGTFTITHNASRQLSPYVGTSYHIRFHYEPMPCDDHHTGVINSFEVI